MSGHLPECPLCNPYSVTRSIVPSPLACICPALRACEARVDKAWHEYDQLAREGAYLSGVQAARDAVADCRVPWPTATGDLVNEGIDDALAAIDALKGEQA